MALHRFAMAAAGWNQETKARLSEKVAVNMNDLASLTKHVLRGSKSSDVSERLHVRHLYFAYPSNRVLSQGTAVNVGREVKGEVR